MAIPGTYVPPAGANPAPAAVPAPPAASAPAAHAASGDGWPGFLQQLLQGDGRGMPILPIGEQGANRTSRSLYFGGGGQGTAAPAAGGTAAGGGSGYGGGWPGFLQKLLGGSA